MKHLIYIILILLFNTSFSSKTHIFEEIAVNYFFDNLQNTIDIFRDSTIYFDGKVNSHVTVLFNSCISDRVRNKEIQDQKLIKHLAIDPDSSYWKNNQREEFVISIPKKAQKTAINSKKHAYKLIIRQSKQVGTLNYVDLVFDGQPNNAIWEVYIVINRKGKVVNWCYDTIRF